ncbi:hypothetical protein TR13x_03980 [Caloranaerobacter sp. TR13]|uniref:hypothetical protein n=1 Tax=Caloranaerobacter sp. TR13 TaxID=1302151 RepID=UPI0006D47017|nr:hypothetical protein [Caloranaerobacter sp. TR13]KPU27689.1 hypothetical protein TR13x_03980 [Caloranaerobacter sp. TR13]
MNKLQFIIKKVLLFLLILHITFSSYISFATSELNVDVNIGFNGYIKAEKSVPINITIQNNYKDIDGKIQVLIDEMQGPKKLYKAYTKEIQILKGQTKTVTIGALFDFNSSDVLVRIVDNDENIIWQDTVYTTVKKQYSLTMGILSENVKSLEYLSLVYIEQNEKTKSFFDVVDIDGYIPNEDYLLETFDVIVINNFDIEKMTSKQMSVIDKWVKKGGVLLVGTGENFSKTLKGFKRLGLVDVENISDIENNAKNIYLDKNLEKNKEKLFVVNKEYGRGHIYVMPFNLGESPFANWNHKVEFISKTLEEHFGLFGEKKFIARPPMFFMSGDIVERIPKSRVPSVKAVFILLLFFILLVGPINYILLKKYDKRELGFITIPVIVLVFLVLIYSIGTTTSSKKPIVNSVSIIELIPNTELAEINTLMGVMSFKNEDVMVSLDKDVNYSDSKNSFRYNAANYKNGEIFVENYIDNPKHITFYNRGIWDVEIFNLRKDINLDKFIKIDINMIQNQIKAEVSNLSSNVLEDAVLVYGTNKFIKLGDIKGGQIKTVDIDLNKFNTIYKNDIGYYKLLDLLFPAKTVEEDEDILNNYVKRSILQEYFEREYNISEESKLLLIAWSRENIYKKLSVNGKNTYIISRNLIVAPIKIKLPDFSSEEGNK